MTVNPAIQAVLSMMAGAPAVDYATIPAAALRAMFDTPMPVGEPIAMARVEDVTISLSDRDLAARLYVAEGASSDGGLTLYYHGGGWVIGTLDTHDATCRALARESGAAVLSVAYRLAPEHPYPAAAEDAFAALCWAKDHAATLGLSPRALAVAGDSAGGNLAAAAAIMARDAGGPALAHQLLIYPVAAADFGTASYRANGGGNYFLSTAGMRWFWDQYLAGRSPDNAPLAAILSTADFAGLPPATVITAQYDPLRDEGDALAARLADAGVPVDAACAPGMIHGFFSMFALVPDALDWVRRGGTNLAAAFARHPAPAPD